jgi:hypothetical protein
VIFRSLRLWMRYLDVAYPTKPADRLLLATSVLAAWGPSGETRS